MVRSLVLRTILTISLVALFGCGVSADPPGGATSGSSRPKSAKGGGKGIEVIAASASRYAVLVGVNNYEKCSDLRYCNADVAALGEELVKIGFDRRDITMLTDVAKIRPSRRNILEQLDVTLKVADPTDLVIVALSGHGARIGGKSYFCPMDARPDDPDGTMIPIDWLYASLQRCPARLKMVFIDACRNKYLPVESKPLADQQKSIDGFAKSLSDGDLPKGVVLLASCTSGERSWEDSKLGHGVFMHYVLKGLSGGADRASASGDQDGWVSLFELCDYVHLETKTHVRRTRRTAQRPYYHTSLDLPDFKLTRVLRGEWPKDFTNSIGMKFKLIPAGEFMMGSPEDEENHDSNEKQHRVRITKPYYLGVHEVTQEQYEKVMGENPSRFKGAMRPVERVTWDDAVEFCKKLSTKEGRTYRLPTEAQWEYACRAGTTTPFHFGGILNGKQANCDGDYPYGTETKGPDRGETAPVGSYRANAWGLYDMHGNVWELCADRYDSDYYEKSPTDDPMGPATGWVRVRRGGGWMVAARYCRSALRLRFTLDFRNLNLGFRVALVPSE